MNYIDKLARELAKQMRGLNDHEDSDFCHIKTALASYGDECAKQMREDTVLACNHAWTKAGSRMPRYTECQSEIRALPLPSEKVKK